MRLQPEGKAACQDNGMNPGQIYGLLKGKKRKPAVLERGRGWMCPGRDGGEVPM